MSAAYKTGGLELGFEGNRMGKEILLDRTQSFTVGRQLFKEVTVISGVPQGSVLASLPFLVNVNDICNIIASTIRPFADDCIIYRKITNKNDIENLEKDLDTLGEWVVENGIKINPVKLRQ